MVSTNDARPGMALDLPDGLFSIVTSEHVKPGKGKAFVRMKLKNIETGQVVDKTFRAGEDVQQAIIERRDHQFLYRDDMGYHFMNLDDFSQIPLTESDVGEAAPYLLEGATVSGATKPVTVETGLEVQVPLFVESGDRIKVDTRTGEYLTRA